MKSLFFNAEPADNIVLHPTGYDREYDADDYASFFEPFFNAAGVMPGITADACQVTVKAGAVLTIRPGCAYVKGRMVQFDGTEEITITKACKIVARMNKTADVRAFQFLAVDTLVQTNDIYDLQLATATLTPISGGFAATVTDTRTYMAFTGQPPYYPPDSNSLPYVLWLYTLGYPMTPEQRASVTSNPSLMKLFNESLGAAKAQKVTFTESQWVASGTEKKLVIAQTAHGRQSEKFTYTLRHLVGGAMKSNTWSTMCAEVKFVEATKNIEIYSSDAFPGEIVFSGS